MRTPPPKTSLPTDSKHKTPSRSSHSTAYTDRSIKQILRLQLQLENQKLETKTLKLIINHQKQEILILKQIIEEMEKVEKRAKKEECQSTECVDLRQEIDMLKQYIEHQSKQKYKANKQTTLLDDLLMMRLENASLKEQIEILRCENQERKNSRGRETRYVEKIRELEGVVGELKGRERERVKEENRRSLDRRGLEKDNLQEQRKQKNEMNVKRGVMEIIKRVCPQFLQKAN